MGKKTIWTINIIYQDDPKKDQQIMHDVIYEYYLSQPNKRKAQEKGN